MKYLKRQEGIVLPLVVGLVALVFVVVGVAVYNARQHKTGQTASTSPSPTSSPVSTATAATDPYSGWQTYKSSTDGITFKYPADWKIIANQPAQVDIAASQGDASFRLVLRLLTSPSTQYDKSSCSNVRDIETVTVPNLGAKKMVAYGPSNMVSRLALTDDPHNVIGQEAGCSAVFASKAGAGKFVDLSAWYGSGDEGTQSFTLDQFTQKPEIQTAEKVLRSVTY